jgi:hypothetical protein
MTNVNFKTTLSDVSMASPACFQGTLAREIHKIERKGTLPNSVYEASITIIQKLRQEHIQKGELQATFLNEY